MKKPDTSGPKSKKKAKEDQKEAGGRRNERAGNSTLTQPRRAF